MSRRRRPPRPGGRPRGARKRRKPPKPVNRGHQVPDTPEAQLEERTRKDVVAIMNSLMKDTGLVEEQRLLARIMEQHPEHGSAFADAEHYKAAGDRDSAFLHVALHRIVEERVVSRKNTDMTRTAGETSWHDAVHEQLEAVAEELFPAVDEVAEEAS